MIQENKKHVELKDIIQNDSKYSQLLHHSLDPTEEDDIDIKLAPLHREYSCGQGCPFEKQSIEEIEKSEKARKKLLFASAFCVVFMLAEFVGGYLAHSIALMSDALHLLSDCGGLMISVIALVHSAYFFSVLSLNSFLCFFHFSGCRKKKQQIN